jgi:hypothetical protein
MKNWKENSSARLTVLKPYQWLESTLIWRTLHWTEIARFLNAFGRGPPIRGGLLKQPDKQDPARPWPVIITELSGCDFPAYLL